MKCIILGAFLICSLNISAQSFVSTQEIAQTFQWHHRLKKKNQGLLPMITSLSGTVSMCGSKERNATENSTGVSNSCVDTRLVRSSTFKASQT